MLGEYEAQIARCFKNDAITLYHREDWQKLQETGTLNKAAKSSVSLKASAGAVDIVSPLLTSRWGQSLSNDGSVCNAYNFYVTETSSSCTCSDKKCSAGCVAVAMAQVMYYWKYPVYRGLNMSFDWCNMADILDTNRPNYIKERDAVAYLIRRCGYLAGMNYCRKDCASGTTLAKARDALVDNFGYNSNADRQMKMWHSNSTWKNRMKSNLDNGWPVIYGGQSSLLSAHGHAFVCDGYDTHDFFHFNFGWRGRCDAFLSVDNLVTKDGDDYDTLQEAIFYLRPSTNQEYCDFNLSLLDHYMSVYNDLLGQLNRWGYVPSNAFDDIPQHIPKYAITLTSAYPATVQGYTVPSSWYTIEPGQTVEYVAHGMIVLKSGFHVKAGSNFRARIDPCANNCTSAMVMVRRIDGDGAETEEEIYIAVGDNEEEQPLGEGVTATGELQVYPNPTTGLLTIRTENDSRIQMIELYSAQGEKMLVFSGNRGTFQEIDISHLPSQIYILKILVNGQIFTKRLILQK
jgi:hypothetical protein